MQKYNKEKPLNEDVHESFTPHEAAESQTNIYNVVMNRRTREKLYPCDWMYWVGLVRHMSVIKAGPETSESCDICDQS